MLETFAITNSAYKSWIFRKKHSVDAQKVYETTQKLENGSISWPLELTPFHGGR